MFGTMDITRPETVFKQMDFKPMVFGSFGEMSKSIKEYIELAVDYGAEHLGKTMAATTVEVVKGASRRLYRAQLSAANWRGLANLVLDRTKYVGTGHTGMKRAQIRQEIRDMADQVEYFDIWMAHET
jgi:hypothetical protein